jgi:hypothetical protein
MMHRMRSTSRTKESTMSQNNVNLETRPDFVPRTKLPEWDYSLSTWANTAIRLSAQAEIDQQAS